MSQCDDRPIAVARRRGRPVNSDSAETRNRILRASRLVINERGYQAATFQSISVRAGLSRPTLHYYFASRLEIYQTLIDDSAGLIADLMARARQPRTLAEQFAALVAALRDADAVDRSQVAFLVSARLESTRNPELRAYAGFGVQDCLRELVQGAKDRGELATDTAIGPVVEVLHSMFLGVGFYAGFVTDPADLGLVTGQLDRTVSRGLPTRRDTKADTPSAVGGRP
ncbi:TetR family transcriptional regulator [Mycobacterium antarcticum]|uniref:TetR/AcrR family transcriptional regulator n=1 Tax=unclassified Mycolicibacterium TaxID=2636767 RepID=UPI00239BE620|nr:MULTISPECIES: TetR/AcrR family transcriptional regulator [unclassified Mycolicibacterium]BDX32544.1 TetR family transcriptional regulator [Mycolicibacterium sp. TUM20985]GLP75752.1 TetR family transcriptional regulator [Mycolicibacterium sp. TUM20983]GLP83906.1 TetR family transcriptional regulator [Mycolicibacterium sp. TUM20984]